ncbi:MAG: sigma-70 family RNA polymerase sigma factor [Clostridiales bacterium]|jgi:RNA polymerase sigma-70 factor (ECF subfamily)|nr:sigma-70 family RNA polymerase sigma factor [Clostridiales bacterium]
MKSEGEAKIAIEKYADTVRRICFIHLKSQSDVEDVFQEVFLKFLLYPQPFQNEAHEKAWLIRVAINQCKDILKSFFRRNVVLTEDLNYGANNIQEDSRVVLNAVLSLPEKYRDVVYLYYYEGYQAKEIAKILNRGENTIYTWLSRAKSKLRASLGGELFD